jgi:hypothetical protein
MFPPFVFSLQTSAALPEVGVIAMMTDVATVAHAVPTTIGMVVMTPTTVGVAIQVESMGETMVDVNTGENIVGEKRDGNIVGETMLVVEEQEVPIVVSTLMIYTCQNIN